MKILLLCLVFAVLVVEGKKSILPVSRLTRGIVGFQHALTPQIRHKRDIRSMLAEFCAVRCMNGAKARLARAGLDEETKSLGTLDSDIYKPGVFDSYCGVMRDLETCVEDCGLDKDSSSAWAVIERLLNIPRYLCEDKYDQMKQYLSCYATADSEVNTTCRETCGDPDPLLERMKKPRRTAGLSSVNKLMTEICTHLQCSAKCQAPIVAKECDSREAAEILNTFVQRTMTGLQEMLESLVPDHMISRVWPSTCRRIAENGIPMPRIALGNENETDESEESDSFRWF